jgi:hypothetical protein
MHTVSNAGGSHCGRIKTPNWVALKTEANMTETQPDSKDAQPDEVKPEVVVTPPKAPPAPKPDPWDE